MALVLNDRVKETSTSTGTGTINLAGAVQGFTTFVAGIGNSNTTYYCIEVDGGADFEIGIGTVTDATPDTLSRDTILRSSNSNNAVNFSAGDKNVFCTQPAGKAVFEDASGNVTVAGTVDGIDIQTRDGVLTSTTTTANAALARTGGSMTGQISFGDNVKANFGAGDDLQIFHDGSNSIIKDAGTGNLQINAASFVVNNAANSASIIVGEDGGSIELYENGSKKFETTSTGTDTTGNIVVSGTVDGVDIAARDAVLTSTTTTANAALPKAGGTMTGNLLLGDGVGAKFGDSQDLSIFHDTNDSVIRDSGTGALEIRATDFRLNNSANTKNMIKAYDGDRVELFYDNNKRVETSNAGITVTGGIAVTGTVDGRDVATDGTKLDGIEASADVTDTANVTSAGALMDSEVTNLSEVKSFDSSDYATAAQGTKADAALPKAGGTMTGDLNMGSNEIYLSDNGKLRLGDGQGLEI